MQSHCLRNHSITCDYPKPLISGSKQNGEGRIRPLQGLHQFTSFVPVVTISDSIGGAERGA